MVSTSPKSKFSGLLSYKHNEGRKELQFLLYMQRQIQTYLVISIFQTAPSWPKPFGGEKFKYCFVGKRLALVMINYELKLLVNNKADMLYFGKTKSM
jgi:hypothetical protein